MLASHLSRPMRFFLMLLHVLGCLIEQKAISPGTECHLSCPLTAAALSGCEPPSTDQGALPAEGTLPAAQGICHIIPVLSHCR